MQNGNFPSIKVLSTVFHELDIVLEEVLPDHPPRPDELPDHPPRPDELPDHLRMMLLREENWMDVSAGLDRHASLTERMRAILVDWLFDVAKEFELCRLTMYRAVEYLDRFLFLSSKPVERDKLQLLGCACTLIACKFEEVCHPEMDDFVFITDNTYSREEIICMESIVLNVLGWDTCRPTSFEWLGKISLFCLFLHLTNSFFQSGGCSVPKRAKNVAPWNAPLCLAAYWTSPSLYMRRRSIHLHGLGELHG